MTITGLRVAGAMVLFWTASLSASGSGGGVGGYAEAFAASLLAIVFNQGVYLRGGAFIAGGCPRLSPPKYAAAGHGLRRALSGREPVSGKKVGGIAARGCRCVAADTRRSCGGGGSGVAKQLCLGRFAGTARTV